MGLIIDKLESLLAVVYCCGARESIETTFDEGCPWCLYLLTNDRRRIVRVDMQKHSIIQTFVPLIDAAKDNEDVVLELANRWTISRRQVTCRDVLPHSGPP